MRLARKTSDIQVYCRHGPAIPIKNGLVPYLGHKSTCLALSLAVLIYVTPKFVDKRYIQLLQSPEGSFHP
jgi:hypothetical protein